MVGRDKKHLKLKILVPGLFPGPRSDPHMRPRGNPHGPQGNLRLDLEATCNDRKQAIPHPRKQRRRSLWSDILLCFLGVISLVSYHCDLPRGPIAGCLEVCVGRLEVSSGVASRSQVQVGNNFETKIFVFRCFLALPTKMSFTTPHYYPKYDV